MSDRDGNQVVFLDPEGRKGYILGWLDVSKNKKLSRVFVAYNKESGDLKYVYDNKTEMPKGLFIWEHDKFQARGQSSSKDPNSYGNTIFKFSNGKWVDSKNNEWKPHSATHRHPSQEIVQLITWSDEDAKQKRLFRPYFFQSVFGFTEQYWREFIKKNRIESDFDGYLSQKTQETISKEFQLILISDLKKAAEKRFAETASKRGGSFIILDGKELFDKAQGGQKLQQESYKLTDIRYLQALAENNGAFFQIASNFDCLEGGVGGKDGTLEGMLNRPSQGEEATIATVGAAFYRKYVLKPCNLLHKISDKISVKDGRVTELTGKLDSADIDNICIGVHKDVVVTSGYAPGYSADKQGFLKRNSENKRIEYQENNGIVAKKRDPVFVFNGLNVPPSQKITQIFTAALNINSQQAPKIAKNLHAQHNAQTILKAMYIGTILTAYIHGAQKLILTLVGAGAFRNNVEWIIEALNEKITLNAQEITLADLIAHGGIEVMLIAYYDQRPDRDTSFDRLKPQFLKFGEAVVEANKKFGSTVSSMGPKKEFKEDLLNQKDIDELIGNIINGSDKIAGQINANPALVTAFGGISEMTPLMHAINNYNRMDSEDVRKKRLNIISIILDACVSRKDSKELLSRKGKFGATAFLLAVEKGAALIPVMQKMLDNGVDVNESGILFGGALVRVKVAHDNGLPIDNRIIDFLIDRGVDIYQETPQVFGGEAVYTLFDQKIQKIIFDRFLMVSLKKFAESLTTLA